MANDSAPDPGVPVETDSEPPRTTAKIAKETRTDQQDVALLPAAFPLLHQLAIDLIRPGLCPPLCPLVRPPLLPGCEDIHGE